MPPGIADDWRERLETGALRLPLCGGLTTFSAFGYETVSLLQSRAYAVALAYAGGSFVVALLAVVIGISAGARLAH